MSVAKPLAEAKYVTFFFAYMETHMYTRRVYVKFSEVTTDRGASLSAHSCFILEVLILKCCLLSLGNFVLVLKPSVV